MRLFVTVRHSTASGPGSVEWEKGSAAMSKNERQRLRKPATRFAQLQKKMRKQKARGSKSGKK